MIPVNDNLESTQVGGIGYRSIPDLSGASALGQVGEELSQAGNTLANTAGQLLGREKKLQAVDDHKWATEAYLNAKDSVASFKAMPDVANSEDIAQKLKDYSKTILDMVPAASAPSGTAYKMFRESFDRFSQGEISSAYDTGYANKVASTVQSVRGQISTAIGTYRKDKDVHNLLDSVAAIKAFTSNSFDKFSPDKSRALKSDLATETVLAVMNDDPPTARAILNSEDSIDEQLRHRLQGEIEQAARVKNSAEVFQFKLATKNAVTAAEAGNITKNPFDLNHYEAFFGEAGASKKAEDDFDISVYAGGNAILRRIEAFAPEYQQKVISNLNNRTQWGTEDAVYRKSLSEFVAERTKVNLAQQEQDPAGWLQQYNPHVQQAAQQVKDAHDKLQLAPDDQALQGEVTAKIKALNDAQLLYQGPAPKELTNEESKLYLNRPQNQWTLLPTNFAEKQAGELNSAKPKEFLKKTAELLAQYPDDKQRMVVFNDLVTKGKLSQQYQMAWLNKDAWWVDTYLGFVAAGKDIKVPETTFKEIDETLAANKDWLNLRATMIGDDSQRAKEMAGFQDGIRQFAAGLVATGRNPKDAVKLAADKLVNTELGFTKVNGRPLMLLRSRGPNLPHRTDEQLQDIGTSLGYALQQVPIKDIDQTPFLALQAVGTDEAKTKHLGDEINTRAFWQTGNDGASVSLYAIDENNLQAFQIRDKQGKPFIVHLDELPTANIAYRAGEGNYVNYGNAKAHFDYFGQRVNAANASGERPTWMKTE